MDYFSTFMIVGAGFVLAAIVIGIIVYNHNKNKWLKLEPNIDYTMILSTSNSSTTYFQSIGDNDNVGMAHNSAKTKFLVIWKNGNNSVIEAEDNGFVFKILIKYVKI